MLVTVSFVYPFWIGCLLLLITLPFLSGFACYHLQRYARLRHPLAIVQACYFPEKDTWVLERVNREKISAELCGDSILTLPFSLLLFKYDCSFFRQAVMLAKDSVSQTQYRRLRQWWRQYEKRSSRTDH